MSDANVVTVQGLVKAYGGRRVVDELDVDIAAGEMVGLIGANGAGKTTAVECIQGLRRPDAGALCVLGLNPVTEGERLRPLIGSQLQSSALPDRLRVGEAVRLFCGRRGEDLLEQFGLAPRWRSAFASLSGGERQRLFMVLALVNHPRLVILDELTQGLDPSARRSVWAAINQLRAEGTTVLLVTHEIDEAEQLCDRVIVMRSGRVLDSGTPAELVDRHRPTATISFTSPVDPVLMGLASRMAELPGVRGVEQRSGKVVIVGTRRAIAHVGAALVKDGWIPPDLSVRVPSLEDALIGLLDRADRPGGNELAEAELRGAMR